jgi:hypothetical protein
VSKSAESLDVTGFRRFLGVKYGSLLAIMAATGHERNEADHPGKQPIYSCFF